MSRVVSVSRLAKSANLDPCEVALALIDRGLDIDDPERDIDPTTRKIARAVIREMLGGPKVVRQKPEAVPSVVIEPGLRSPALIGTLSVEDVLFIHDRLCADFTATSDPITPPGVRSTSLLESAVCRQQSGYAQALKYPEPVLNAATLLYGICNDHPFHNGNKRTALVAALAHLDRNRLVLQAVKQRELFRLMLAVASHTVVQHRVKVGRETTLVPRRATADEEVVAIAEWLRPRVTKITRGETPVTYRELRQILSNFGFSLHLMKNQKMAVCAEARRRLFRRSPPPKTRMALEWPGEGRTVSIGQIKHIRKTLHLQEEDGVTRETFYGKGARIDHFINEYRLVLRQLAAR